MQDKLQSFSSKVYAVMAGALVLSGLAAWLTSSTPLIALAANPIIALVVAIVDLGLVIWLSRARDSLSPTTAGVGLAVYSVLDGFLLSYVFLLYELGSVLTVFLASAAFFLLLSLVGRSLRLDLSKMSTVFLIGLIAIIVVSVINIFVGSSMLTLLLNVVSVILFAGLTIHDAQKVSAAAASGGDLDRLVVPMALQLYLDFVNIFLRLLELFGKRKD